MSRDAKIELDWADGTYTFRLAWGQLAELQERCDAGPYVVHQRLVGGTWFTTDIYHVLRLGLIGGGMEPSKALGLVRAYVEGRPPVENLPIAQAVIMAALMGAPDDKVGETVAPEPESK